MADVVVEDRDEARLKRNEYMRNWTAAHREKINAKRREKYAADPTLRERTVARNKKRWRTNPQAVREYNGRWKKAHPETARAAARRRYASNHAKATEKRRRWRATNPERYREISRVWKSSNRGKVREADARRRAIKRQQAPPWSERKAVEAFYAACPAGFHVDHIIPLAGKTVRGLHVLANLQYLPAKANLMKSNRFLAAA